MMSHNEGSRSHSNTTRPAGPGIYLVRNRSIDGQRYHTRQDVPRRRVTVAVGCPVLSGDNQ